jgi:hypothetical protein
VTDYLYRVRITNYPDGAVESDEHPDDERMVPVSGWAPPGWKPEGNYVQILGTEHFVWPTTKTEYRSARRPRSALSCSNPSVPRW